MIRKLYTPSLDLSALKGQQVLSPGQRPGYRCIPLYTRPDRAKAFTFPRKHGVLLHFQRDFTISISPRALPWAKFYWAFSPFLPWWWDKVTHPQTITLFLILRFSTVLCAIYVTFGKTKEKRCVFYCFFLLRIRIFFVILYSNKDSLRADFIET